MNKNQNDNRAPQAPLRSNWAGNKSPINNGCVSILKGESRFKSKDVNFARTVNDKKKSVVQLMKEQCRERRGNYLKRGAELKLMVKGYKKTEQGTLKKGFHEVRI